MTRFQFCFRSRTARIVQNFHQKQYENENNPPVLRFLELELFKNHLILKNTFSLSG